MRYDKYIYIYIYIYVIRRLRVNEIEGHDYIRYIKGKANPGQALR